MTLSSGAAVFDDRLTHTLFCSGTKVPLLQVYFPGWGGVLPSPSWLGSARGAAGWDWRHDLPVVRSLACSRSCNRICGELRHGASRRFPRYGSTRSGHPCQSPGLRQSWADMTGPMPVLSTYGPGNVIHRRMYYEHQACCVPRSPGNRLPWSVRELGSGWRAHHGHPK